jgi:hypothetical protein
MLDEFQFEADERVFSCYVATLGRKSEESWWWFSVSGDSNRYAPFRRLTSDTPADVQRARGFNSATDSLRRLLSGQCREHGPTRASPAAADR